MNVYILIIGIALLLSLIIIMQAVQKDQKNNPLAKNSTKGVGRNYLYNLYVFYSSMSGLKNIYRSYSRRLRLVYPADSMSVNFKTAKQMTRDLLFAFAAILFTIIVSSGDIFFVAAGIVLVIVMFISRMNSSLDRMQTKLIGQMRDLIDKIREQYNKLGRVDDALNYTMDSLPFEISLHANEIYNVLTSTDIDKAMNEYIDKAPNKFFMVLAMIMSSTMNFGDKKMEDGSSLFLKNLNFLKEEVNIELLKEQKTQALFSGLSVIAMVPIFLVKPIENWAIGNVPQLAAIYKGTYGIVCMVAVFVVSLIVYTIVESLKSSRSIEIKDNDYSKAIAETPGIRRFLNGYVSRNYTKSLRQDDMLRFTGDQRGINAFLVRRFLLGIGLAFLTTLVLTTSVISDRKRQLNDFSDSFDSSIVTDKEAEKMMEDVAVMITKENEKNNTDISNGNYKTDLAKQIMETTDIKDETQATMVAEAVQEHTLSRRNTYFKWFYLFPIFIAGIIGYMIPLGLLYTQVKSMQMNMEDEVSQFQTIVLILMHVDGVDAMMILEWMERFAFCFKDTISTCIIDFPMKGQKALKKMEQTEHFPAFQSLVGCLESIDDVGVETAFSNIETDREYYKEKRKEDNEIMLQRRSQTANLIAMIPLMFVFGMYMIYPMVKLAISMMSEITTAAAG